MGFPGGTSSKESTRQCRRCNRCGFDPWVGKIPWRREWQPTPVFFPGESHEQRSLANYSALCRKESDTTEDLTHTTHKACITRVIVCVFFVTCFYSTLCFWQSFRFIHFRYYVNSTVDEYSPIYPFYFLLFPNLSCVLLLYTGLQ